MGARAEEKEEQQFRHASRARRPYDLESVLYVQIAMFRKNPKMHWVAADVGKACMRVGFDGVAAGNWLLRAALSAARQDFDVYLQEYLSLAKEAFMFASAAGNADADGRISEIEKKLRLALVLTGPSLCHDYVENPVTEL